MQLAELTKPCSKLISGRLSNIQHAHSIELSTGVFWSCRSVVLSTQAVTRGEVF